MGELSSPQMQLIRDAVAGVLEKDGMERNDLRAGLHDNGQLMAIVLAAVSVVLPSLKDEAQMKGALDG